MHTYRFMWSDRTGFVKAQTIAEAIAIANYNWRRDSHRINNTWFDIVALALVICED